VHEGLGVRWDLDIEDADGLVLEGQVMMGLGGDFYGSCGLRG
jgi:hypothetical protein